MYYSRKLKTLFGWLILLFVNLINNLLALTILFITLPMVLLITHDNIVSEAIFIGILK